MRSKWSKRYNLEKRIMEQLDWKLLSKIFNTKRKRKRKYEMLMFQREYDLLGFIKPSDSLPTLAVCINDNCILIFKTGDGCWQKND